MYNATIQTKDGKQLDLGFEYGIVFDVSPLSGVDVDIATSQSFQQIGESVENTSVLGLTREIFGVIMNNEKSITEKLLSTLSAFSSGKLKIGDRYCEFTTQKTPYINREKSGRLTFSASLYCPYPFWIDEKTNGYVFGGVTPAFSFPVLYDSHIFGVRKPVETMNCYNRGNVRQTFNAEFSTFASVSNFGLRNVTTGSFMQIAETISGNDVVNVYQDGGKIRIELTSEGETSNIIAKLVDNSTLFELETGDNIIVPFADEGLENLNVSLTFSPAYTGVYV